MSYFRINFYSESLQRDTSFDVFIPNDNREYVTTVCDKMRTLFLLHGYSGAGASFGLEEDARKYNLALVMPNGENSFYLDHEATGRKYCTYVGKELVEFVRKTFGLARSPKETFITGFSMGGFGALHTALAFPETFSMSAALSSALIVHEVAGMKNGEGNPVANYEYYRSCFGEPSKVLESEANPEFLVKKLIAEGKTLPKLFLACGTEDFLIENNRQFHKFLEDSGVCHEYFEDSGSHDFGFWSRYFKKAMQWMSGEPTEE